MATEDFTFPTIIPGTSSRFINSPPLWRSSSAMSFPEEDAPATVDGGGEKMDMLWEDFNNKEIMCRNGGFGSRPGYDMLSGEDQDQTVEMGCVKALTASRNGRTGKGNMISARRPAGMVLTVKILKRLFLIHKSPTNRSLLKRNLSRATAYTSSV